MNSPARDIIQAAMNKKPAQISSTFSKAVNTAVMNSIEAKKAEVGVNLLSPVSEAKKANVVVWKMTEPNFKKASNSMKMKKEWRIIQYFNSEGEAETWIKKENKKPLNKNSKYKIETNESVNEGKKDYEIYHNSYTEAIQEMERFVAKNGYEMDEEDLFNIIGGTRKPGAGKTNSFTIPLYKKGKLQKKAAQVQVYGMSNGEYLGAGKYELNTYIS